MFIEKIIEKMMFFPNFFVDYFKADVGITLLVYHADTDSTSFVHRQMYKRPFIALFSKKVANRR